MGGDAEGKPDSQPITHQTSSKKSLLNDVPHKEEEKSTLHL